MEAPTEATRIFSHRATIWTVVVCLSALLVVVIVTTFMSANFKSTTMVQLGSSFFHLWLADDEQQRIQGLSGVTELKENGGLLMDFKDDGKWGIWMKDMPVPLDIIWLDKGGTVVHIEEAVDPSVGTSQVFTPRKLSRYVIEVPAGNVKASGIQVNQAVQLDLWKGR